MTATIVTLRHNHVDARTDHLLGMFNLADHRHDLGAIGMQAVHPRFGIAKTRSIDGHFFLDHHFHLRFKELLREELRPAFPHFGGASRPHGRLSINLRKAFAVHEIAGELLVFAQQFHRIFGCATALRCGSARDRGGQQRIDAEGLVGQLAGLTNPVAQLFRRTRRRTQHAQPARIRYCRGQCRNACTAHAGQQDRIFDSQHFTNSASQCHFLFLSAWMPFGTLQLVTTAKFAPI